MKVRIEQIKLPITYTENDLKHMICKELQINSSDLVSYEIVRRSLDARKRSELHYSFLVQAELKESAQIKSRLQKLKNVSAAQENIYHPQILGTERMKHRPVIVGAGPAGLFCAYFLAKAGYRPILLERGDTIAKRTTNVERFWRDNLLDVESNVQFGEGGAGTYSDGKLNTMVKDTEGRIRKVLETFVHFGADQEILYVNKPHIGTDCLRDVITNLREEIERLGGNCNFRTKLTKINTVPVDTRGITKYGLEKNEQIFEITTNDSDKIPCDTLVLALGHSARDTFSMLYESGIHMEKKAFAIGVRVEHPQQIINQSQYGEWKDKLPAADYKLTHTTGNGRGVYSFCMCPGGFVVNASSENGRLAINGMSNHDRGEINANSAIVVTVTPCDFEHYGHLADTPLAGMEFQRQLEAMAYHCGKGLIPLQLYGDFVANRVSKELGTVIPNTKGGYTFANLKECLPDFISQAITEAMPAFARKIPGFDRHDVVLEGVESRTSSPIRIIRNENLESNIAGIYPCGEGAGYAGGIVSAAADGLRVYEAIIKRFCP